MYKCIDLYIYNKVSLNYMNLRWQSKPPESTESVFVFWNVGISVTPPLFALYAMSVIRSPCRVPASIKWTVIMILCRFNMPISVALGQVASLECLNTMRMPWEGMSRDVKMKSSFITQRSLEQGYICLVNCSWSPRPVTITVFSKSHQAALARLKPSLEYSNSPQWHFRPIRPVNLCDSIGPCPTWS